MRTTKKILLGIAFACVAIPAHAQSPANSPDPDEREAYRRGYEEGFARGYRKGLDEGGGRPAPAPPPPPQVIIAPPPPPVATGPIRVTGAYYGTDRKNCDATKYVQQRASGKHSYSFDVSNNICGDPAKGERKSLEVTYRCGQVTRTASANEHRTIYLSCS
jgi:hypothetical protein